MKLKDKLGNQIEIYQARNGSVQLLFGHNSIALEVWQIDALGIDCHLRDIDDFDEEKYHAFYKIISRPLTTNQQFSQN